MFYELDFLSHSLIFDLTFRSLLFLELTIFDIGDQPYNLGDLIQFEHRHIYTTQTKEHNRLFYLFCLICNYYCEISFMSEMMAAGMRKIPNISPIKVYSFIEIMMANGMTHDDIRDFFCNEKSDEENDNPPN